MVTHDILVQRAVKWLKKTVHRDWGYRTRVVLPEYYYIGDEIPGVIGFCHLESIVIKCKIGRNDFLPPRLPKKY
jgi:hypothetical protein